MSDSLLHNMPVRLSQNHDSQGWIEAVHRLIQVLYSGLRESQKHKADQEQKCPFHEDAKSHGIGDMINPCNMCFFIECYRFVNDYEAVL